MIDCLGARHSFDCRARAFDTCHLQNQGGHRFKGRKRGEPSLDTQLWSHGRSRNRIRFQLLPQPRPIRNPRDAGGGLDSKTVELFETDDYERCIELLGRFLTDVSTRDKKKRKRSTLQILGSKAKSCKTCSGRQERARLALSE